ncbi:hypothetical protein J0H33_11480 [bacterium]|nr:hypothetical protein [bacterium]
MDAMDGDDAERYRVEAIAAFSHEIRTPITSLKMLVELGRRHGAEGEALFDRELTELLVLTVDELTRLVDDMQQASRLMRGMLALERAPQRLSAVLDNARDELPAGIEFEPGEFEDVSGMWDGPRLAAALAQFAVAVDRLGDGLGNVRTRIETTGTDVMIEFTSGGPPGSGQFFTADAGYGFFRARQLVIAAGGSVECRRSEGFSLVRLMLPLTQ